MTEHPLSQYDEGRGFLVSKDSAVVAELNGFYNMTKEALDEYEKSVREIEKIDPDLIPEKRAERQHRALQKAKNELQAKIDKQLQFVNAPIESIKEEVSQAAGPVKPESETGQLMQLLKEQEIRRELKDMERTERAKLMLKAAGLGDRSILQAAERSLTPLVESSTLDNARSKYEESIAGEPLQRLGYVEHISRAARATAQAATGATAKMIDSTYKDILPMPQGMSRPVDPEYSGMSAADKVSFSNKHGQDALLKLASGEKFLGDFE